MQLAQIMLLAERCQEAIRRAGCRCTESSASIATQMPALNTRQNQMQRFKTTSTSVERWIQLAKMPLLVRRCQEVVRRAGCRCTKSSESIASQMPALNTRQNQIEGFEMTSTPVDRWIQLAQITPLAERCQEATTRASAEPTTTN
jgi:outer membrane murein-binding lipoprotein Lpp